MKHAVRLFFFVTVLQLLNAQWTKTNVTGAYPNCLTANNGTLYLGLLYSAAFPQNTTGVLKSTDNGNTWTPCNTGLPILTVQTIKVFNSTIFIGMEKGKIYKSTDDGTSWVLSNNGIDTTTYVMHLEQFNNKIFAGTNNKGIYVSTDDGATWQQHNTNIVGLVTGALYASATDLFAGVNNKNIFRYDNASSSWTKYSSGMPNNSVNAFGEVKDGQGNKYLFAGLYSSVSEVALSTDNGANWSVKDNGLPNQPVHTMLGVGANVFLGNEYGVYRSTDFGANWSDVSTGIGLGNPAYSLTLNGDNLFVIASAGVWKRALSEMTPTSVEEVSTVPSEFTLFQNYPNPFNPATVISYQLPANSYVTLKVYDILGKEIETLVHGIQQAGKYEVMFDASHLTSGMYLYRLQNGNTVQTHKMILNK